MEMVIRNPEAGMHGNSAENIFIAFSDNNEYLGHAYVYAYINTDMTPEHPFNLHISIQVDEGIPRALEIKEKLFERVMARAHVLRSEQPELKARIYGSCFAQEHEKLEFLLGKGFIHDDGTYLFERELSVPIPELPGPEDFEIRVNRLEAPEDKETFLELHKAYFVREFSAETLAEMKKEKGWINLSAYLGNKLAGNIMLYEKADEDDTGIIDDLFVVRDCRGLGIGSLLTCTALRYFSDIGLQRVQLHVWGANKRAIALYESLGFSFMEELECYPGIPV